MIQNNVISMEVSSKPMFNLKYLVVLLLISNCKLPTVNCKYFKFVPLIYLIKKLTLSIFNKSFL